MRKEKKLCAACFIEYMGVKQSRTCSVFCKNAISVTNQLALKRQIVEELKLIQNLISEADELKKSYDNYVGSAEEQPTSDGRLHLDA
jgi:hypothetical protein